MTNLNKKKIYLAGKVAGLKAEVANQRFATKERQLWAEGYDVYNPVRLIRNIEAEDNNWERAMKERIPAMLQCDALYLFPDWDESNGARLERDIALRVRMPIVYLETFA